MNNKKMRLSVMILVFVFAFTFLYAKKTYGVYRDTLNTKVYLSILDPSQTYTITLMPEGGNALDPVVRVRNEMVGVLPTPTRTDYNFVGWYTYEGTKVDANAQVTADVTYYAHWVKMVCKKAADGTLHSGNCYRDTSYDSNIPGCLTNYGQNQLIEYGTISEEVSPVAGNAYDCDVNNDGVYSPTTERFYYVREILDVENSIDQAVLVHYTNYDENGQSDSSTQRKIYLYDEGKAFLPDSTIWTNPALTAFDGKVSRYINQDDLETACGATLTTSPGYLDTCEYFMENSRFQSNAIGRSAIWIEKIGTKEYRIDTRESKVVEVKTNSSSGVRPTIEIPYNTIDGYRERAIYTVTFNSVGGTPLSHLVRYEGQAIGPLSMPLKDGFTFGGWFLDPDYEEEATADTIVTKNLILYAKWNEVYDDLVTVFYIPGSCTFHGGKTEQTTGYITTSSELGCVSTINPSNTNIDYVDTPSKYIDTKIALFSAANADRNFEISFIVDDFVTDDTVEAQATLLNSKLENSSLYYPGFVVRRQNGKITLTEKFGNNTEYSHAYTYTPGIKIRIARQNGSMYYALGDEEFEFLQDIHEFDNFFNLTAWIGAYSKESNVNNTGENSTPGRYFNGTISNFYIKMQDENVTTHSVEFNAHEGTASFVSKEVRHGAHVGELPTASYSGYYFDGWYTEEHGGRKIDETEVIRGDIEYHAHYKNIYYVTFDANGGQLSIDPDTVAVVEGERLEFLPNATLAGYVLDEWYTPNGEVVDISTPITADITYHAEYIIGHTITFDGNGTTPSFASIIVGHGKTITLFPEVYKLGFSLVGWYIDGTDTLVDGETTITQDEDLVARWEVSNDVAAVNGRGYETLQAAIEQVPTDGTQTTVTILKDITLTSKVPVAATQNITLDMGNHTISGSTLLFENSGTIEIHDGTINNTGSDKNYAIDNKSSGKVYINGGVISSTNGTNAISNAGRIEMTAGRLTCTAQAAVINNNTGATMIMSGGEITGSNTTKGQAIYNDGGTLTIQGTAYLESRSNNRGALHNNAGTVYILGGTIIGKGNYSAVVNNATMTIGTDDGVINTGTPVLQGKSYGLEVNEGKTAAVYDGIFKGKTKAINDDTRTTHPSGTDYDTTETETIGTDSYKVAYLYALTVRYNITFDESGGETVSDRSVAAGEAVGSLPTTSKTGAQFIGWYTSSTGGNRVFDTDVIDTDTTFYAHFTTSDIVCQRASILHHNSQNTVTFGQLQSGASLQVGDAYDCDVDGDGYYDFETERFYYLTESDGNAILIYYNNTSQSTNGGPICDASGVNYGVSSYDGPTIAASELPSTSQWKNVGIYSTPRQIVNENGTATVGGNTAVVYDYIDRSARLATLQEIEEATGVTLNGTASELAGFEFLFENTAVYGTDCRSNYWLETPLASGTNVYRLNGASGQASTINLGNAAANNNSAVRPVIEVPLEAVEREYTVEIFDIMSPAMRTYFDNISTWSSGQTDNSHASYDTAMTNNLNTNDCVYFQNDNRDGESLTTYCDQPNKYDTGVNGAVNVYKYDMEQETLVGPATYVTANQGKLYNMIPGETYYWESASDSSVNGYVQAVGERRILSIDNVDTPDNAKTSNSVHKIRNVRDLGGIAVTYQDANNQTVTGTIKYGKLFRGEKIWGGDGNTVQYFTKLGITNEMDLRGASEKTSAASTEDNLSHKIVGPNESDTFEIIHYGIDYDGYIDKDGLERNDYALSRNALKAVMQEFVTAHQNGNDDYALFFHCRIGADRTGTLAYLLEGVLGVSEEDRYRDYELTVFFGLRERTRFYYEKTTTNDQIKFVHMKQAIRDAGDGIHEDVVTWFLKGSADATERASDMQLIQDFRSLLVDRNS